MAALVSVLLVIVAGIIAVPVAVLFIEVVSAVLLPQRKISPSPINSLRPRVAVLVPAHNESTGLLPTLADIKAQLHAGDRMLVVADNCTDNTAAVAAAAGAEVVVRTDSQKIGKGYALEWGIRLLSADPPDIVVIIDADCRLGDTAIGNLATTCTRTGRPTQALDLMLAPKRSAPNHRVAEFTWRVKNWVRPLGLSALGLPCQLMGTGMAFPWKIIGPAKIASGQPVEDLSLGLDLAIDGCLPIFCPSARVTSTFPISTAATARQRQRWEHGHIDMILMRAPSLIWSAIMRRNLDLLALALDLAIPPLVLLGLLTIGMLFLASADAYLVHADAALIVSVVSFATYATAILVSWMSYGRDILPPRALWLLVPFALSKFCLYWRFLSGSRVLHWTGTDRK
jgi:cellulose synthase/poly-beta-1,6-N-acetylglucosamine synthase-like glycosyltransferase